MKRFKPAANTYLPPTAGWWRRNPYYLRYMVREASAVFLSAYALLLLFGLWRLRQGEAAFEAWRATLESPAWLLFHAVALVMVAYHSLTWFQVMPKTAPRLPFDPKWITRGGLAVSAGLSLLLLAALRWGLR